MLNLIKADLYKSFHRLYLYVFMGAMIALTVFCNAVFASMGMPFEMSLQFAMGLLMFPLFFVVMFVDIVTAEENKEHTFKNTVSFGLSRNKIFLAKNISAVLVAAVVAAVTLSAFFLSAILLLHPEKAGGPVIPSDYVLKIAVALLLYIAAISLGTLLAVIVKRNSLFTFSYFGILVLPALVFKLLSLTNPVFAYPEYAMLFMQTRILAEATHPQIMMVIWNALAHIAVFQVLGLILFKKQEIN